MCTNKIHGDALHFSFGFCSDVASLMVRGPVSPNKQRLVYGLEKNFNFIKVSLKYVITVAICYTCGMHIKH